MVRIFPSKHSTPGPYTHLVDYCQPIKITKRDGPVLFMQLWHPEVASIERTTFIRSIVSNKEKQDALAKLVNSNTEEWEKTHKEWRTSEFYSTHHKIEDIWSKKMIEKLAKMDEKDKQEATMTEEERQKGLQKLEQKRELAKEKAAVRDLARKKREAAQREKVKEENPWMETPIMLGKKGEKLQTSVGWAYFASCSRADSGGGLHDWSSPIHMRGGPTSAPKRPLRFTIHRPVRLEPFFFHENDFKPTISEIMFKIDSRDFREWFG